ncbi:carbon monoxide dehydrogenase [Actinomadura spongiicola]|uniref:Carbon monoxide dehydrogenase n=1 Tax=Actinomadura spongiicola TaxID=2303421 RepID=A0A372GKG6_9ACTN|nr:carbon monoxide dehydrogenase subunit G [Actinomadura spongiicola]RFS85874.1 carbon monoxide dehydrogenase [Actinomadura spongiicola]
MQLTGSATVAAPLARVWDALQDPAVLARTIPGCRSLEETGPDTYRMTVSAGVASLQGTYVGQVELADPDPPRSFVLRAHGQGAPGTVDATVRVRLTAGDGATRIDYDADAVVGGMVGGVGQRMLGSVAKRTAGQFFAAVERDLTAPAPAPALAEPAPAGAGTPAHTGGAAPAVAWPMVIAFGSGGLVALVGVALGYLLGRRSRRD